MKSVSFHSRTAFKGLNRYGYEIKGKVYYFAELQGFGNEIFPEPKTLQAINAGNGLERALNWAWANAQKRNDMLSCKECMA